jgi:hypothetical protein
MAQVLKTVVNITVAALGHPQTVQCCTKQPLCHATSKRSRGQLHVAHAAPHTVCTALAMRPETVTAATCFVTCCAAPCCVAAGDLCVTVAKDCGTGPGSPCCPTLYRQRTNPELPRGGCPGSNEYCNPDRAAIKRNEGKPFTFTPGTCLRNAPDCGKFGKSCCQFTTSSSSVETCEQGGRKGYCANPPGYKEVDGYRYAPENERVCTPCPAKVDAAAEAKQPALSSCT